MRITTKVARGLVGVLDETREKISKETKEILETIGQVYDFSEYERRRKEVKDRINDFPSLVNQAISTITIAQSAGRPKKLNLPKLTPDFMTML